MVVKQLLEYDVDDSFELFLLVKKVRRSVASSGDPYLILTLQDRSGELDAYLWKVTPAGEADFVAEAIVRVVADVQSYKGKKQLKLRSIRLAEAHEPVSKEMFLPQAPVSKDVLMDKINKVLLEMTNSDLQRITRHLLKKHEGAFYEFPAASKNHHSHVSGLAFHTVSMLEVVRGILPVYPYVNKDLLYAGVILHDMGKVLELSGVSATSYTLAGNLLGHIQMMAMEVGQAAMELDIDSKDVMLLQHMILSHHGKEEWGSPKRPMLPEAELLHMVDAMDARMNMLETALAHVKPGEFSEKVFSLEGRMFLKQ